jgi:hypothetical protein
MRRADKVPNKTIPVRKLDLSLNLAKANYQIRKIISELKIATRKAIIGKNQKYL